MLINTGTRDQRELHSWGRKTSESSLRIRDPHQTITNRKWRILSRTIPTSQCWDRRKQVARAWTNTKTKTWTSHINRFLSMLEDIQRADKSSPPLKLHSANSLTLSPNEKNRCLSTIGRSQFHKAKVTNLSKMIPFERVSSKGRASTTVKKVWCFCGRPWRPKRN